MNEFFQRHASEIKRENFSWSGNSKTCSHLFNDGKYEEFSMLSIKVLIILNIGAMVPVSELLLLFMPRGRLASHSGPYFWPYSD